MAPQSQSLQSYSGFLYMLRLKALKSPFKKKIKVSAYEWLANACEKMKKKI